MDAESKPNIPGITFGGRYGDSPAIVPDGSTPPPDRPNVYVPSAEVTHLGGHATRRVGDRMLAEHHRSTYRYLADRHPGVRHAPLRLGLRAGLATRLRLMRRAARGG